MLKICEMENESPFMKYTCTSLENNHLYDTSYSYENLESWCTAKFYPFCFPARAVCLFCLSLIASYQ